MANLSRPEAMASSPWSSASHDQEQFDRLTMPTGSLQNMVGFSGPHQSQSMHGQHALNSMDVTAYAMQMQWQQK